MKYIILSKFQEQMFQAIDSAWKGYLSLFIAMALLFMCIGILNTISKKKEK